MHTWLFIMMPSGLSLRVQDGWLGLPKAVAACLHGENSHLHKTPSSLWETISPVSDLLYCRCIKFPRVLETLPNVSRLCGSFPGLHVPECPGNSSPSPPFPPDTWYPYSWEAWFHVSAPASVILEPKLDTTVDTAQPCKVVPSPCLSLSRLSQ